MMNHQNQIRRSFNRYYLIYPLIAMVLAWYYQAGWAQTLAGETTAVNSKEIDKTQSVEVLVEPELGIVAAPSPGIGVLIKTVFLGTPADHGGLRSGDFLMAIDEQPLSYPADFYAFLKQQKPGESVKLQIWRNEREFSVEAILAEGTLKWSTERQAWVGIVLGDGPSTPPVVRRALPSSPAAEAGLQAGDVVLRFNGANVSTNQELIELIAELPAYSHIALGIRRGETEQEIKVATSSRFDAPWGWRHGALHHIFDDLHLQWENLPEHDHYQQRFHDWRQQIDETMLRLRGDVERLRKELLVRVEGLPAKERDKPDSSNDRGATNSNKDAIRSARRAAANVQQLSIPIRSRTEIPAANSPKKKQKAGLTNRFQYYGDYYRTAQLPQRTSRDYQSSYQPRQYHTSYPPAWRPYYYYHYFPGDVYYGRTLYEYDPRLDVERRAYLWGQKTH